MTKQEIVTDLIVGQFGVEFSQVIPTANLVQDLGADSMDEVELIMALEEEFGIDVADEDAEKMKTVQDVLDYVEKNVE